MLIIYLINEWSKQSAFYDKEENLRKWGIIGIKERGFTNRTLMFYLKQDNKKLFDKFQNKAKFIKRRDEHIRDNGY